MNDNIIWSFNEQLQAHRTDNLDIFTVYTEDTREIGTINGDQRTFTPHPECGPLTNCQVSDLDTLLEACYYRTNPDMHPLYEARQEQ